MRFARIQPVKKWEAAVLSVRKNMGKSWQIWGRTSSDDWLGLVSKRGPRWRMQARKVGRGQAAESLGSAGESEGRREDTPGFQHGEKGAG